MTHAERRVTEPLLRRNAALACADAAAAAALLARAFAAQGLDPPSMPSGFASLDAAPPPPVEGPLVSIVVSAFEAEATLATSLRSVLAQSWRNIELLVVDDASTDGTAREIARFAAADPRVRPLAQRRNGGTYAARNLALRATRGAFVTFHDADDWMHPRRIETEMAAFTDARVLAVNSCWFRVDASGRAGFRPRAPSAYANPSFALFRAAALRRLGAYDGVRFSADTEMIWRARLVFGTDAIATLPVTLTIGLSRPGSLTTDAATGMDMFGFSAPRTAYHEAWRAWHLDCDDRGAAPHLAPGDAPPHHVHLPSGMAAGES
jgi:cellulose synthase/poly-beta-1,6-N-acetylglucosamine synthase-like glycosyltransferase